MFSDDKFGAKNDHRFGLKFFTIFKPKGFRCRFDFLLCKYSE